MRYSYCTLDVFTDRIFGGNPLAVLPDAAGLAERQMQLVAREFSLSETAFVTAPADPAHTRRVRIFTPAAELPFAGHPTIGTAVALALLGEVPLADGGARIVLEEAAGPVPVEVRAEPGRALFAWLEAPRLPERGPPPPSLAALADVLSLTPDLLPDAPGAIAAWSAGVPFLFVPVRDRGALASARIDLRAWQETLAASFAPSVYVFTFEAEGADLQARMFAPEMGIREDPATGAAAAALAGYLAARQPDTRAGTRRWTVHQGVEMGRPSVLEVEADLQGGAVTAVRVGGSAVLVSEGEIEVPTA